MRRVILAHDLRMAAYHMQRVSYRQGLENVGVLNPLLKAKTGPEVEEKISPEMAKAEEEAAKLNVLPWDDPRLPEHTLQEYEQMGIAPDLIDPSSVWNWGLSTEEPKEKTRRTQQKAQQQAAQMQGQYYDPGRRTPAQALQTSPALPQDTERALSTHAVKLLSGIGIPAKAWQRMHSDRRIKFIKEIVSGGPASKAFSLQTNALKQIQSALKAYPELSSYIDARRYATAVQNNSAIINELKRLIGSIAPQAQAAPSAVQAPSTGTAMSPATTPAPIVAPRSPSKGQRSSVRQQRLRLATSEEYKQAVNLLDRIACTLNKKGLDDIAYQIDIASSQVSNFF